MKGPDKNNNKEKINVFSLFLNGDAAVCSWFSLCVVKKVAPASPGRGAMGTGMEK